jgi:dienelactone hydrolase
MIHGWRWAALLSVAGLIVTACVSQSVSEEDIKAAYKAERGPYTVASVRRTSLNFPQLDKRLAMRVAFPEEPGSYPLISLSHGNGCLQDLYVGFADHWVSWGYVVIQPVHMDSRETGFTMRGVTTDTMNQMVANRPKDVSFILDSLDQLEAQVPGLAGKIDRDRMVAAGHSMGGGTAMTVTGVRMYNPESGFMVQSDEDRFDATIVISDPSNNRIMPNEPWRLTKVPTLIATGSEDFSTLGSRDGKKVKDAFRLPADAESPDQPRYYLDIDGMDHYLGGVMCRSNVPGPRDFDGQKIINATSTAFMDAYIKNDLAAKSFLTSNDIAELTAGRATLGLR